MHFIIKVAILVLLNMHLAVKASESEIEIEGLNDKQETNVRAYLSLTQENCESPSWRIKKLYAKVDEEIAIALRALGYYQPKTIKQLNIEDDCWQLQLDVSVGEPVRVTSLTINIEGEAKQEAVFQELLLNLPLKIGDILNHALYERIKKNLHSLSQEHGYLKSQIINKTLEVDPVKKQATIVLTLDSGPRHHFGNITLNQNILATDFVQGYVEIKQGDQYSRKKLTQTYRSLADSQYFSNVEIKPELDNIENNQVPVQINLSPKKTHDYSLGVGYDTDIGPLASVGYQNRRINRKGHHFNFDLDISPVRSSAEGRYMIPFTHPHNDYFSIAAGYKYEKPNTFESEEAKLSLQYQHIYSNGWNQTVFLDFSYEDFIISDIKDSTTLIVPGIRWQYAESNNKLRPTQGYTLNFSLSAAHEQLISDFAFVQATASGKLISSLPWSARMITRINLGGTLTSAFDQMPTSYRFFAGGNENIRGYGYKELGPVDDENNVFGGKMLTIISAEYEQFINKSWGVAAFFDAGNAYNLNEITIKTGTGMGLRWISPIGPIRIDFAVPLSDADDSFQIHFSAGTYL